VSQSVRVLNWNVEWATPRSPRGPHVQEHFRENGPDLICLTEGQADLLPASGHVITSQADTGYPIQKPQRRKVLFWSRSPWKNIDDLGSEGLPSGRFIAGTTQTKFGLLRVIGKCIPWSHAHVSTGRRDRRVWQDHLAYLTELKFILNRLSKDLVTIVVGDFNQLVPRHRAPEHAYTALMETFDGWSFATEGTIPGLSRSLIDHVAIRSPLTCERLKGIPRRSVSDLRLSDHDGIIADFTLRS
jgi:hypothetical protein